MANVRIWGIVTGVPAITDVVELQRTSDGASLKATLAAVAAVLPFPASPASNKQVLFDDAGTVAGDAGLTYDKTTNTLTLGVASSATGVLKLAQASSGFLTTIQAGAALAARTYVWPTDFGSAGDVLTDAAGDGILSWAPGGGGGTPGGSDTQVQFNDATAFGGDAGLTYDKTTKVLTLTGAASASLEIYNTASDASFYSIYTDLVAADTAGISPTSASFNIATATSGANNVGNVYGLFSAASAALGAGRTTAALYGLAGQCYNAVGGTVTTAYALSSDIHYFDGVITTAYGLNLRAAKHSAGSVGAYYGVYGQDLAGQSITNPYYLWADSRGVYRIREDNVADGSGNPQAVTALYNPRFTKYTAGAADYERVVQQWVANVATIGTEAGGTGTLRALNLIGSALTFNGSPIAGTGISALTGDVAASGSGSVAATLATVNSNVGSFGSATQSITATFNAKGLVTAASATTITPAVGSITGLGTDVATALGVNVGSAGAFVTFNGAGGTPSSLTLTNATGLPPAGVTGTAAILGANTFTALQTFAASAGATFPGSTSGSVNIIAPAAAGTGTVLTLPNTSMTLAPVSAMTDAWNNSGTTFSAIKMSVTDTASAAGSKLIDLLGGASGTTALFSVDKNGTISAGQASKSVLAGAALKFAGGSDFLTSPGSNKFAGFINGNIVWQTQSSQFILASTATLSFDSNSAITGGSDTFLSRPAAATIQHGAADSATPVAQTIQAQGSRAGTDTNVGGASLTIQPGNGTGTGTAASIVFKTPVVAASGTSAQTQTAALTIQSPGVQAGLTSGNFASCNTLKFSTGNYGIYGDTAKVGVYINGNPQWQMGSSGCALASNIAFGWSTTTNDPTQTLDTIMVRSAAATLQHGAANAASPVAQTVQAQGSRSGTDNNVAGANFTIQSGAGTGSSTGSSLIFKTPLAVASGTGAQTMTAGLTLAEGTKVGFYTATPVVQSTGYGTPTNGAKQASFDATTITLPNLAASVAQLIIDLKSLGLLAA